MYHFCATLSRIEYINRWGLMRNTRSENTCEHSLDVAVITHALALLRSTRFSGSVNPERAAILATFHDVAEVSTGDLPTPVKYDSPEIRQAYRRVEEMTQQRLLALPLEDLREAYEPLICENGPGDGKLYLLVKATDKISALIKYVEECGIDNAGLRRTKQTQRETTLAMGLPEAECFLTEFLPSYGLTLDKQNLPGEEPDPANPQKK